MERDFTDVIRGKSQFEENAVRKISDTRQHEGYITNDNVTTASAMADGRTIKEKLQDYKYEVASRSSGSAEAGDVSGFKTETEIHSDAGTIGNAVQSQGSFYSDSVSSKAVDGSAKEEMVSSNLFTPTKNSNSNLAARNQSYMAMIGSGGGRSKSTAEHGRHNAYAGGPKANSGNETKASSKYSGETAYDTATGRYAARNEPGIRSYTFKGNQVQGAAENVTGKYAKAYSSYVGIRKQSAKPEVDMTATGRYTGKTVTASEKGHSHFGAVAGKDVQKATDRLKSYKMSDTQGVTAKPVNGAKKPATKGAIKDSKVIKSNIASKAKGSVETKSNLSGKTKGSSKETFSKKLVTEKKSTGKYKKKIGQGSKRYGQDRIRTAATGTALYKMTNDSESQNSAVEAARASAGTGYSMYSKLNRKVNNANAQKYVKKSKSKSTGAKGSGKYSSKASKSVTTKEAQKKAQKLAEQRKAAQKYRAAKHKQEVIENTVMTVKQAAISVARKTAEVVARNWKVLLIAGTGLVLFIAVSAGLSSCAMAFTGGTSEYIGGLAGSEDVDFTEADSYFTEKEMLLQEKIDNIQEDYPDYDEYIMDIDEIGHDALKLMAFLSAEYETYDLSKVKDMLDTIFDEMYELTIEPKTEIRTRMVEKTGYDETTGETYTYEVEEEYEWKMLFVTLKKKDWDSIIEPKFTDDKNKEMYEIYDDTDGGHQAFYNPFTVDWSNNVTSEFGWRIHPVSGKEKFHNGIDIGLPAGTEIHACATGTVIQSYYSESAGNYIGIQDETGYTTHYMHLSVRSVSVGDTVKHGDVIGQVGSTGVSTGPHLHLGVKNAEGEWLNPRFMVSSFAK